MNIASIIALGVSALGVVFSILVFAFNRSKDARKEGYEDGATSTLLAQINKRLDDIVISMAKQDGRIEDMQKLQANDRERLGRVEESCKQAHKRIDELKGGKST